MRWLAGLLALLSLCSSRVAAFEAPRRNVLLIIADDLGLQLGCYGDAKAKTPQLDALAKSGVRFTHAFATVASCSPSRATLFTGLHTHTSGQYGLAHAAHHFHTRANVRSLPALLNAAGYLTGILGKFHTIPESVYPYTRVFQPKAKGGPRNVSAMARAARGFFDEAGKKPFCLVVGYTDPHRAAKGFANGMDYPGVVPTKFGPNDVTLPYFVPDTPAARADLAEYYQSVNRLDQGVGMLLRELRDAGRADDTLVIFLSDNGIPFPGAKTTLYDSGLNLPLIVVAPTLRRRGLVNEAMVSWVDVTPTILDWAGVRAPANLAGRSFLPVLEETRPRGWDRVFGSHQTHEVTMYYPMRMVRTRTHKLIRNLAHRLEYPFASDLYNSPTWQDVLSRKAKMMGQRSVEQYVNRPLEELYDLRTDPNELRNVAGEAGQAATLAELRRALRAWQEATNDPWLIKYRHE